MKKFLKITGILLLVVLVGLTCVAFYVKNKKPDVGPPETLTIEKTAERVAHGKYLANSVTVCMDCHSQRDFSIYAGPIVEGTFAAGGEKFGKEIGFPGTVYSRNISPYGIGDWTDGELFRAITTGVTKDGNSIFPIMPYLDYGKLDKEDIMSIIAYIRTLPSVTSTIPTRELEFPLNFLINTIPKTANFTKKPNPSNSVDYGKYIVTAAACMTCHSKEEKGNLVPGTEFGGGRKFVQPGGVANSANLTPDNETGIGSWNKELFIKRFKMYTDSTYKPAHLNQGELNTPMPWLMYATMTEGDLGAMYDYLRTVKSIKNKVIKFQKN